MDFFFLPFVALLIVLGANPTKIVGIKHQAEPDSKFSLNLDICHRAHCIEAKDGESAMCTTPSWGCYQAEPGKSIIPGNN